MAFCMVVGGDLAHCLQLFVKSDPVFLRKLCATSQLCNDSKLMCGFSYSSEGNSVVKEVAAEIV